MRELRIEHAHHMTPGSETACFLVHPMFASQLDYQVTRNIIAKLMQYAQLIRGWFCPSCFFHGWFPNRNHSLTTRPTFSFSLPWDRIGFELLKIDLRNRHMVFRCTHYDPATKLCDSYHSRPGRCRDYPRNLLTAPRPQFFSECSYFAVDRNAERYRRALERFPITEEKREELFERLYLIEK